MASVTSNDSRPGSPNSAASSAGADAILVPLSFSIIIANYNYVRYVARAIESALALDWPWVEVIVVDDGSSDGSQDVIRRFGRRINAHFRENRGQRVSNNIGFGQASGQVIVFLDADDVLDPQFAREVAAVWAPGVSKVQVQMRHVDAQERTLGSLVPAISVAPRSDQIRSWAISTSEYPTPPGSGNAYSRDFLERFFPIGREHDSSTDSTCLALAPILGDVVTVLKPLVRYRLHGANDSDLFAEPGRFGREVNRAMVRQRSIELTLDRLGIAKPPGETLRRSLHMLQLRVASLRLDPAQHPLPGDSRLVATCDVLRSLFRPSYHSQRKRALVAAWSVATLVAPQNLARRLVAHRFSLHGKAG